MSIFNNPTDEDKICGILRTYVEEWGPEHVIVSVPTNWQQYDVDPKGFGKVRVEYTTVDCISIRVEYEQELKLAAILKLARDYAI